MDYQQLIEHLSALNEASLEKTVQAVNFHLTLRNWLVGRYIFEYEQNGEDRAKYGDKILQRISKDLGKGYSERNLKQIRLFSRVYSIRQTLSAQLQQIIQSFLSQPFVIPSTLSGKFSPVSSIADLFEISLQSFFHFY